MAVGVYTLVVSLIFWFAIKAILGLRVSKEEEMEGLDIGEHGEVAYVGFGTTTTRSLITNRIRRAHGQRPADVTDAASPASRPFTATMIQERDAVSKLTRRGG